MFSAVSSFPQFYCFVLSLSLEHPARRPIIPRRNTRVHSFTRITCSQSLPISIQSLSDYPIFETTASAALALLLSTLRFRRSKPAVFIETQSSDIARNNMRYSYTALVLATLAIGNVIAGPFHHVHLHHKKADGLLNVEA